MRKEASGYMVNEYMWEKLQDFKSDKKHYPSIYQDLAKWIAKTNLFEDQEYSDKLSKAMLIWVDLAKWK
jgi:hypothetical protein